MSNLSKMDALRDKALMIGGTCIDAISLCLDIAESLTGSQMLFQSEILTR
jgi:hypothetical protein